MAETSLGRALGQRVSAVRASDGQQLWSVDLPDVFPATGFNSADQIDSGMGLVFVGGSVLTAFVVR